MQHHTCFWGNSRHGGRGTDLVALRASALPAIAGGGWPLTSPLGAPAFPFRLGWGFRDDGIWARRQAPPPQYALPNFAPRDHRDLQGAADSVRVLGALRFHHGDDGVLDGGLAQLAGRLEPLRPGRGKTWSLARLASWKDEAEKLR
jgi:hypothetical protein